MRRNCGLTPIRAAASVTETRASRLICCHTLPTNRELDLVEVRLQHLGDALAHVDVWDREATFPFRDSLAGNSEGVGESLLRVLGLQSRLSEHHHGSVHPRTHAMKSCISTLAR